MSDEPLLIDALAVGHLFGLDVDHPNEPERIRRAVLRLAREGGLVGIDGIGTSKKFYRPEVVSFIETRINAARMKQNGAAS